MEIAKYFDCAVRSVRILTKFILKKNELTVLKLFECILSINECSSYQFFFHTGVC